MRAEATRLVYLRQADGLKIDLHDRDNLVQLPAVLEQLLPYR